MTLAEILLGAALLLHPETSAPVNSEVAARKTIQWVIEHDCRPGHAALGSCEIDAVAMLTTAWEEGPRFCFPCHAGDNGRSSSMFQVMGRTPEDTALYARDLTAAAREAYAVMRIGAALCPAEPLAPYAGGCHNRSAKALAHKRLARTLEIWKNVMAGPDLPTPPPAPTVGPQTKGNW